MGDHGEVEYGHVVGEACHDSSDLGLGEKLANRKNIGGDDQLQEAPGASVGQGGDRFKHPVDEGTDSNGGREEYRNLDSKEQMMK